jgi:hypothetical protein
VPAAAAGKHDEVGVAEQAGMGLGVDGQPQGDDVVDPGLDRTGRTKVVQRKAEQDRVGLFDLVDQFGAERERHILRRRALLGGHHSRQSGRGIQVRYWVGPEIAVSHRCAGMGAPPPIGGAVGQPTTHRVVASDRGIDVKQV